MPNLSIKDVPEHVVAKLRERAARNHRSLQGELMALVCQLAEAPDSVVLAMHPTEGTLTPEEFFAELDADGPEAYLDAPLAVDIIRADRDAR